MKLRSVKVLRTVSYGKKRPQKLTSYNPVANL